MFGYLKSALFNKKTPPPASDTLSLDFTSNEDMRLGVEIELQIVDKNTLNLADISDDIISSLKPHTNSFVPEWFKAIIEMNTSPQENVLNIQDEIIKNLHFATSEAEKMGCELMGCGCHPTMHYADLGIRKKERYGAILDRNQWVARRWMVSGMHIHIGMESPSKCIRYMHFFEHYIPHFIALSASSPYWQSHDTGLHSCRSTISESLPTAALMYSINSWSDLKELVKKLVRSKTITSLKDLHWDIRPSPAYGTLEIRVFDMPTNVQDVTAIAAFVHTLALWFRDNADWLAHMPKPQMWMARENKWRATRHGLDAEIIVSDGGRTEPIREDFRKTLERIADTARANGYTGQMEHIQWIIDNGNSSDRQRQVYETTGSFDDVIRHNLREFRAGHPISPLMAAGA